MRLRMIHNVWNFKDKVEYQVGKSYEIEDELAQKYLELSYAIEDKLITRVEVK
jgi:hypothetical protein